MTTCFSFRGTRAAAALLLVAAACNQQQDLGHGADGGGGSDARSPDAGGGSGGSAGGVGGSSGAGGVSTGGSSTGGAGTGGNGTGGAAGSGSGGTNGGSTGTGGIGGAAGSGRGGASAGSGGAGGGTAGTGAGGTTPPPVKRVFITRTEYSGNLGGLAGGDLLCTGSAESAGMSGRFKAWLSDDSTSAIDRIADVGPWYSTSGAKLFNSRASLTTLPSMPIDRDEFGFAQQNHNYVWTGTLAGGRAAGPGKNCNGWTASGSPATGSVGNSGLTDGWTSTSSLGEPFFCNNTYNIYCFEQ